MPAAPVVIAIVLVLVRLLMGTRPGRAAPSAGPGWLLVALVVPVLVLATLAMPPLLVVTVPLAAVLLFPWTTTRLVLVPRGRVRPASTVAGLASVSWGRDPRGAGLTAAALAHLQGGAERSWLESRLSEATLVGAGAAVATGLLASADGDHRLARALMATALDVDEEHRPEAARRIASHWLCAEAASRGAWSEVVDLALAHPTAPSRFLGQVARRMVTVSGPVGSDAELWAAWMAAGHRQAHYELLLRALVAVPHEEPPLDPGEGTLLARAVQALARFDLLLPSGRTLDRAHALGRLWEAALADPATQVWILERSAAVGARPERVLDALRADVVRRLEAVVAAGAQASARVHAPSALVADAAAEVLEERLSAAEDAAEDAGHRVRSGSWLGPAGELRAFASVRAAHEAAVRLGGDDARRVLFSVVHPALTSVYVKLFNERGEPVLANAINGWLLDEARAVGDDEAAELHLKNLDCL